ncbi:unnamed protein product [Dracunculus medinensis]|uniref:Transposase n=1 Tax=Dracunculus medinensis TaxID=318479 RepID=A0A0N4U0V3_DRAME|nr:unnamed protein product [Dracunculus medinensis]
MIFKKVDFTQYSSAISGLEEKFITKIRRLGSRRLVLGFEIEFLIAKRMMRLASRAVNECVSWWGIEVGGSQVASLEVIGFGPIAVA